MFGDGEGQALYTGTLAIQVIDDLVAKGLADIIAHECVGHVDMRNPFTERRQNQRFNPVLVVARPDCASDIFLNRAPILLCHSVPTAFVFLTCPARPVNRPPRNHNGPA